MSKTEVGNNHMSLITDKNLTISGCGEIMSQNTHTQKGIVSQISYNMLLEQKNENITLKNIFKYVSIKFKFKKMLLCCEEIRII